jgi:hypothetical protein
VDELSVHDFRTGNNPNVFDKIVQGSLHQSRADYRYGRAGDLVQGDGYYADHQAWVAHKVSREGDAVHVVAEPRQHFVQKAVVSTLQFGSPGITLEPDTRALHVFHHRQAVPVRQ